MVELNDLAKLPDAQITCLRCEQLMKNAGKLVVRHWPREGILREMVSPSVHMKDFEACVCPNCGKVEFFV